MTSTLTSTSLPNESISFLTFFNCLPAVFDLSCLAPSKTLMAKQMIAKKPKSTVLSCG